MSRETWRTLAAAVRPAAARPVAARTGRQRFLWAFLLALAVLAPGHLGAANAVEETGMVLSTPIRHQLRLLHEAWQSWTRAYYRADREEAETAIVRLQSITNYLGMSRLPDLGIAASAFAVLAAQGG